MAIDSNVQDWNNISKPGIYSGNCLTTLNSPPISDVWVDMIVFASNGNQEFLRAFGFSDNTEIIFRTMASSSWGSWSVYNLTR